MNAKEAKEVSVRVLNEKNEKQYKDIKMSISTASYNGRFEVIVNQLTAEVRKRLIEEGFKVATPFSLRNETSITISW